MKQRKDGRWVKKVTINGKPLYFYSTAKTERQADRDIMLQVSSYKEKEENGKLFTEVADEWWNEHSEKLAPNSLKNYKPAYERTKDEFDGIYIKDIVPFQISKHIKQFSKTHADKTVRTQLNIYNMIFKYAVESGYVLFNPARDLSIPAGLPKTIVPPPSDEDIKRTKDSINCTFGLFAYTAMYTGFRRGELLALDIEKDIDIENRKIIVDESVYHIKNRPFKKEPKSTASNGEVPILDALLPYLKNIKETKKKGLLFPNEKGELMTETQFQRQWELYQMESGVTATPHQYRHAYATMLFEAEVPPEEAQALLRHANLAMTMDTYTALREQKKKKIYEKVYSVDIN